MGGFSIFGYLERWRSGDYTTKITEWMELQKRMRIYQLGSLPPSLLVFARNLAQVDHRWNQHGLRGDNFHGCVKICILIQWVSCIRVGKVSHGLDSMLTGLALWMRCGHLMICYKLSLLLSFENGIIFFFSLGIVKPCSWRWF